MSNLSILAIVLGLLLAAPQIYGLVKPAGFAELARKFPRSRPWGIALMVAGTTWFVWNVSQESIADFAAYKSYLLLGFALVGIGSCIFVQDFLAVRGLAVVLLLLAKLMVDVGRPGLARSSWVLVIQTWAYVLAIVGMWLTISPWRLRDAIAWDIANEHRIKVICGLRLAFALVIVTLGLVKF